MEGPLTQGVNRGIPSKTKGSSGGVSLLEVWSGAVMFQLYSQYFCLFVTCFICCSFWGGLPAAAGVMLCGQLKLIHAK